MCGNRKYIDYLGPPWSVVVERELTGYLLVIEACEDQVRVSVYDKDRYGLRTRHQGRKDFLLQELEPPWAAVEVLRTMLAASANPAA